MISVLPSHIASQIAAGEVIQRPASVIKELMENAVDSGADRIDVVLTDGGATLMQVTDNGCGMDARDAVLAFDRHATSKIRSVEDLEEVETFGFRGEALASIASIAHVRLRTRREEDELGTEITLSGSAITSQEEVACAKGSDFCVRNLFYNVPARRRFLKSEQVELRHILEEFYRVVLCHPRLTFTLTHNQNTLY
ncbi:MAG TPA: DNA mismatch repair endonuclease MutL, partial [Bacteroidales bacterium]|nr:DNA mismatch repair endonuclease MutL [Bacteroidales bacterium]